MSNLKNNLAVIGLCLMITVVAISEAKSQNAAIQKYFSDYIKLNEDCKDIKSYMKSFDDFDNKYLAETFVYEFLHPFTNKIEVVDKQRAFSGLDGVEEIDGQEISFANCKADINVISTKQQNGYSMVRYEELFEADIDMMGQNFHSVSSKTCDTLFSNGNYGIKLQKTYCFDIKDSLMETMMQQFQGMMQHMQDAFPIK